MIEPKVSDELLTLLGWADKAAAIKVFANADTPKDARRALELGAMGIGLVRTERMFNDVDRLPHVVDMIVADTVEARKAALAELLPMQRGDFKGLLEVMAPRPVTIRLLDPPIHEFLPSENELVADIDRLTHLRETLSGISVLSSTVDFMYRGKAEHPSVALPADPRLVDEALARKEAMLRKVRQLHEVNPMLGHRGVRLGLTYPEIYAMQIRAILEAAAECAKQGLHVHPEIMVPQVCTIEELEHVHAAVRTIAGEVEASTGIKLHYQFGSMLEVVRACLLAGDLTREAEFYSFGTNDLTQAVFSFSREDAENKFLPMYNANDILHDNPFESLDASGVGKLMDIAVRAARAGRPGIVMGICGEHGGHPASIRFCHGVGLDYVSCSPPRVPIARLAAAHAALEAPRAGG